MKSTILLTLLIFLNSSPTTMVWAQSDEEALVMEAANEEISDDDFIDGADDDLSDEEELDFETDDFVESNDKLDLGPQTAENQMAEEPPQSVPQSTEEVDVEIEEGPGGEINFKTASDYDTFGEKFYSLALYFHYGFQFANTTDDFTSPNGAPLPQDYTDFGLSFFKHTADSPFFWGAIYQSMTEKVETSTVSVDYKMTFLNGVVGYKLVDDIVSIAMTLAAGLPVSASAKITLANDAGSSEPDFKVGIPFTLGIQSIVKLKRFHIGFDGGLFILKSQEIDGEDFDENTGGYFRTLLGFAF